MKPKVAGSSPARPTENEIEKKTRKRAFLLYESRAKKIETSFF